MRIVFLIVILCVSGVVMAQPPQQRDFLSFQKSFKKVTSAFSNKEESLKAQFKEKGLAWPAKFLYLRSFKYDSKLEVWVKNAPADKFRLFKTYKVCALAGNLGPKRVQGDFQVPEGFYYINQFRPNSTYHMALGVNYPNASDRILSDSEHPGDDIYIHGSCVTVGCIPLTDEPMEELYVLAATTRNAGQEYIPIHVFPVAFKEAKSMEQLNKYLETAPDYKPAVTALEKVYYYFNQYKKLPVIMVSKKGEYMLGQDYTPAKPIAPLAFKENIVARKQASKLAPLTDKDFYAAVYKMPQYPGGAQAFQKFLDTLSAELTAFIPPTKKRLFVQVDFVIDKDGNLVNTKVAPTANNEMNNLILERFEAMPKWQPAWRNEGNVPIRLQQTIMVEGLPQTQNGSAGSEDGY